MGSEITLHGDWWGGEECVRKRERTWSRSPPGRMLVKLQMEAARRGAPETLTHVPGCRDNVGQRQTQLEGGGQAEAVRSGEGVGQTAQGQQGQAGSLRGLSRISGATQESHLVGLRNPGESGCRDCPGQELQDTTGCRNICEHLYRTSSRVSVWMPGRQRHTCGIS